MARGKKTGGRPPGVKNKKTIDLEAAMAMAAGEPPPPKAPVRRGVEIMSEAANYFFNLAAKYSPVASNQFASEPKFHAFMKVAADIASKLAPFQDPRLSSITMQTHQDLSRLNDAELAALEDLTLKTVDPGRDTGGKSKTQH